MNPVKKPLEKLEQKKLVDTFLITLIIVLTLIYKLNKANFFY